MILILLLLRRTWTEENVLGCAFRLIHVYVYVSVYIIVWFCYSLSIIVEFISSISMLFSFSNWPPAEFTRMVAFHLRCCRTWCNRTGTAPSPSPDGNADEARPRARCRPGAGRCRRCTWESGCRSPSPPSRRCRGLGKAEGEAHLVSLQCKGWTSPAPDGRGIWDGQW